MSRSRAGAGGACPSGWWYGLTGGIAAATAAAAVFVGLGRAAVTVDQVEGFESVEGAGAAVTVVEPGDYAVYYLWDDPATSAKPMVRVKYGAGGEVLVAPSSSTYGDNAAAVVTFEVTEPGEYSIHPSPTEGRLTFGERLPGRPFYGFGGTMATVAVVLAGCLVVSLVVAVRRYDWYRWPEDRWPEERWE